jgi:diacylglycerol kinase family enzyme
MTKPGSEAAGHRITNVAVLLSPSVSRAALANRTRLRELLLGAGCDDPEWITDAAPGWPSTAVSAAVAAGARLVLAAGGDGTVRAAVEGIWGSAAVLGILPLGTANVLARNLGIPRRLEDAIQVALFGRDRALDVGRAEEGIFLVAAGMGLDARMMSALEARARHRIGLVAYVASALRHLADPAFEVTVECDGGAPLRRLVAAALVGNVARLPLGIRLHPEALVDDGRLEVVLIHPRGPVGWLRVAAALHGSPDRRAVERLTARRVEIRSTSPQPMELDGDAVGWATSLTAQVHQRAVVVRVPR